MSEQRTVLIIKRLPEAELFSVFSNDEEMMSRVEYHIVDKSKLAIESLHVAINNLSYALKYPPQTIRCPVEELPATFTHYDDIICIKVLHHIDPLKWPEVIRLLNERLVDNESKIWIADMIIYSLEPEAGVIHLNAYEMERLLLALGYRKGEYFLKVPTDSNFFVCRLQKIRISADRVQSAREEVLIMLRQKLAHELETMHDTWDKLTKAQVLQGRIDDAERELDSSTIGMRTPILDDNDRKDSRERARAHFQDCRDKIIRAVAAYENVRNYLERRERNQDDANLPEEI